MMRFETHRVSEYVVRWLQAAPSVARILVDGGDIIEFALANEARVSLHLIESELALYEAGQILRANGGRGVYTLFLFWRDLLLPDHGQVFQMDAWLATWSALYGGKAYGYDFNGPEVDLFPVYFDAFGTQSVARFGAALDPARLTVRVVRTAGALPGNWRVAAFDGDGWLPPEGGSLTVEACYALLGLEAGVSRVMVKRAYRRMARRLHPDVNPSADAHQQMQALNDAYQTLLTVLGRDAASPP
jgi:hypothetical protein